MRILLPLLALGVLAACDTDATGDARGHVRVLLTDAPADELSHAFATIVRVELVGDAGTRVLSDSVQTFDLLTLRNGVTALLATDELPEGRYAQLRLVVADTARVVFRDGSPDQLLKIPSGAQTGIKLNLPAFDIAADTDTVEVVVDFNVDDSFVKAGASGKYLFKPVLKTTRFEINGVGVPTDTTSAG